METLYDYNNGTFKIVANNLNIDFTTENQEEYFHIYDVNLLEFIRDFSMIYTNQNKTTYLHADMRISYNGVNWTPWINLMKVKIQQPTFDPSKKHIITIRIKRIGSNPNRILTLQSFLLNGRILRKITDGTSTVYVKEDEEVIIKPPYIYKVFKIRNMEVISSNNNDLDIEYRFSQNQGRTVTDWEPFTYENITTAKISPIRFFQIEYRVKSKSGLPISIYDINIIGEFQNVTKDSQKSNLFGIRDNCNCLLMGLIDGSIIDTIKGEEYENLFPDINNTGSSNYVSQSYTCPDTVGNMYEPLTDEQAAQLFNPYELTQSTNLLNRLTEDVATQFGHEVFYASLDPDENAIDYTLHEYGLNQFNCTEKIKVIVNNNQFPNDSLNFNFHDMLLFEVFEVMIVKTHFLKAFGSGKRPRVGDLIWFCKLNQTYEVEHAQDTRTFNNYALYYKLSLKKYNKKSSNKGSNEVLDKITDVLIHNSTLGELLTNQKQSDKKDIANKDQLLPLTADKFRRDINVSRNNEEIYNSNTLISDYNYDLSTSETNTSIVYKNILDFIDVSDNISYTSWFNIEKFNITNNLFKYYNDNNHIGFKFDITNNRFTALVNNNEYQLLITPTLKENIWYSIVINLDNRKRYLDVYLYKRNVDFEEEAELLNSTNLLLLWNKKIKIEIGEMDLNNTNATIQTSNMKITNIRLFSSIIDAKKHNVILNQNIIQEGTNNLLLADNANPKMNLMSFRMVTKDRHNPDML